MNFRKPSRGIGGIVLLACLGLYQISLAEFQTTGLVVPVWEATLAPTVLGRVDEIHVKEADRVEAGTVLLSLEREAEELESQRRKIIADNFVEIKLAKAKLEVLESAFEGTKRIYETSGSISKEEYQKAQLELQLAEAELEQLKQRKEIEALDSKLAREQVSKRQIRAPRDGIITEIFPEVGEVCEARQPVIRMVDVSKLKIELDVDALKTSLVSAGDKLPIRIESPGEELLVEGFVEYVSPVVDGASGLRRIRITINNTKGKILPGLPARVTLPAG